MPNRARPTPTAMPSSFCDRNNQAPSRNSNAPTPAKIRPNVRCSARILASRCSASPGPPVAKNSRAAMATATALKTKASTDKAPWSLAPNQKPNNNKTRNPHNEPAARSRRSFNSRCNSCCGVDSVIVVIVIVPIMPPVAYAPGSPIQTTSICALPRPCWSGRGRK